MLGGCVERMTALDLKGKRRDNEAMAYLCGAAVALQAAIGDPVIDGLIFVVSVRGFVEVERALAKLA